MGAVKRDIHKAERDYLNVTFSDVKTVEGLIRFRSVLDPCYLNFQNNYYNDAGNVQDLNQELIVLYVALDKLIEDARLSEQQKYILKKIEEGYEYANIDGYTHNSWHVAQDAFKKIVETNKQQWQIYIHTNYLGTETRVCRTCKKKLPLTKDFFSPDRGGFRNDCKVCRTIRQNRKNKSCKILSS